MPQFALTDTGNAERLVRHYGQGLRYCTTWGCWLVWDGVRWAPDERGAVDQRAKDTARLVDAEALDEPDPKLSASIAAHARRSESAHARAAMVRLAQSELPVTAAELDADPWALNCQSGVVDLRTGALLPHDRTRLHSKLAPAAYDPAGDPAALAPTWHEFLEKVQPDAEVRGLLQRLVGYACTAVIRDHVLPIFFGTGGNGKGTFVETVLYVLGDYARSIPTELLMAKRGGEAHPTERATLQGCRLAAASETEEGRALNVALVKQLTGGDKISARKMRQDFYEFDPTHKLFLSTNHKPRIGETKNAIWRRVLLVPWTVSIPEPLQDKGIKDALRREAAGILRWAVLGCLDWQARGLQPPVAVRVATEEYRTSSDRLADFLAERCELVPARLEVCAKASDLYAAYKSWCDAAGERCNTQTVFGERMAERGVPKRKSNGVILYMGLRLLDARELRERAEGAGGGPDAAENPGPGIVGRDRDREPPHIGANARAREEADTEVYSSYRGVLPSLTVPEEKSPNQRELFRP